MKYTKSVLRGILAAIGLLMTGALTLTLAAGIAIIVAPLFGIVLGLLLALVAAALVFAVPVALGAGILGKFEGADAIEDASA